LYDNNGNLTQEKTETYSGGWSETLKWVYAWNPRDQMKQATKYVNTALAGYVKYQYCLSCDGALSKRLQYNSSSQLTSEKRYEYDGINLLRVDERCDADGDGIVEEGETTWRMVEVATHRPGQLGALVGKRVYSYPTAGNRCVSNGYTVYTYGYDAVGNVVLVFTGGGDEAFFFAQDAFGNELDIAAFASSDWVDARDDGVGEHQTGKWVDPFTGQYYFHARWYDSVVGRFMGRDPQQEVGGAVYCLSFGNPLLWVDPSGNCTYCTPIPPPPSPVPAPTPRPPQPIPQPTPTLDDFVLAAQNKCEKQQVKGACTTNADENCACMVKELGELASRCEYEVCCGFTGSPFGWYHCACRIKCAGTSRYSDWLWIDKYPVPKPFTYNCNLPNDPVF